MKSKKKKETTTYSVRFKTNILDGIRMVAKKCDRPVNATINRAVMSAVEEHCDLLANGKYRLKGE